MFWLQITNPHFNLCFAEPWCFLFENTVDSDQQIEKIAEVNIGIQWWISILNSISIVNRQEALDMERSYGGGG